jgi:hypothetical protein
VDNCPAHPDITELKAIKIFFLPPNTTSFTQPMDAGVIWSFKSHYRRYMVEKRLAAFDRQEDYRMALIDALVLVRSSWARVTEATVQNCFGKAFGNDNLVANAVEVQYTLHSSQFSGCMCCVAMFSHFSSLSKTLPYSMERISGNSYDCMDSFQMRCNSQNMLKWTTVF